MLADPGAIDTTTPAGRLLFHMLAAISEFERHIALSIPRWSYCDG